MVSRDIAKISGLQPLGIEALFAGTIVQPGIDRFLIYEKTTFGGKPSSLIASKTETESQPRFFTANWARYTRRYGLTSHAPSRQHGALADLPTPQPHISLCIS